MVCGAACACKEFYEKVTDRKKIDCVNILNNLLIWNKVFLLQICYVHVPILKPFWRRLVKLFEIVVSPSKRKETQTSLSIAGHTSLHNNFTKRRQNGFKIGSRDKNATHLRWENSISNRIMVIYKDFLIGDSAIQLSKYTSCLIHHICRVEFWVTN